MSSPPLPPENAGQVEEVTQTPNPTAYLDSLSSDPNEVGPVQKKKRHIKNKKPKTTSKKILSLSTNAIQVPVCLFPDCKNECIRLTEDMIKQARDTLFYVYESKGKDGRDDFILKLIEHPTLKKTVRHPHPHKMIKGRKVCFMCGVSGHKCTKKECHRYQEAFDVANAKVGGHNFQYFIPREVEVEEDSEKRLTMLKPVKVHVEVFKKIFNIDKHLLTSLLMEKKKQDSFQKIQQMEEV